jgi:hypothetical protein
MKNLIKLEELAMFGFSIFLFSLMDFAWWWYLVLILAPDIGMIGYAFGTKVGSFTYNLTHHKAVALAVLSAGWVMENEWTLLIGIILFGHSSLDRILGYGLKYDDDFKHTHLGRMD